MRYFLRWDLDSKKQWHEQKTNLDQHLLRQQEVFQRKLNKCADALLASRPQWANHLHYVPLPPRLIRPRPSIVTMPLGQLMKSQNGSKIPKDLWQQLTRLFQRRRLACSQHWKRIGKCFNDMYEKILECPRPEQEKWEKTVSVVRSTWNSTFVGRQSNDQFFCSMPSKREWTQWTQQSHENMSLLFQALQHFLLEDMKRCMEEFSQDWQDYYRCWRLAQTCQTQLEQDYKQDVQDLQCQYNQHVLHVSSLASHSPPRVLILTCSWDDHQIVSVPLFTIWNQPVNCLRQFVRVPAGCTPHCSRKQQQQCASMQECKRHIAFFYKQHGLLDPEKLLNQILWISQSHVQLVYIRPSEFYTPPPGIRD